MEWIDRLFEQYGYLVLFLGLFTESLALPFPGELAMAYSGHLTTNGHFNLALTMACAFLGATIGTTITYFLGQRLGKPFFEKYGKYIFLNEKRLDKLTKWFSKYGSMLLLISYFIPGFRHFTGYFSGISGIRFRVFCFFNHIGALLWVFTYVMIGHVFSEQFGRLIHLISKNSSRFAFIIAVALLLVYILKKTIKIQRKEVIRAEKQ